MPRYTEPGADLAESYEPTMVFNNSIEACTEAEALEAIKSRARDEIAKLVG